MPEGNHFSVGKNLNIGIYDLSHSEYADDLIAKAKAQGKNLEVVRYKGHDVIRVSNKSNGLWEAVKRAFGYYERSAKKLQDYRANLPSHVATVHQNTAQSFKDAVHGLPQAVAKTDVLQIAENKEAPESLKPVEPAVSKPAEPKEPASTVKVAASTEQAAEVGPIPTLKEVTDWYKSDDLIAEFTPGFGAYRLNDFIVFGNSRVHDEIIAADGGRASRPNKRKYEKVHISIDRKQFPQAWEKLAPLIFSKKNPFHQFKLSSLVDDECLENSKKDIESKGHSSERAKSAFGDLGRVSEGLQLTFYFTPPNTGTPSAQLEKEARESAEFLKEIATVLEEFDPGKVYGRTVQLSPYIDYRNEAWARGDTTKPVQEALTVSPYSQAERNELKVSPFFSELEKAFAS